MTEPARPPDQHHILCAARSGGACNCGLARYSRRVICVCHGSRYCPDGKSKPARPTDQRLAEADKVLTHAGALDQARAVRALSRRVEVLEAALSAALASVSARPKPYTPDDHASDQAARRYENHLEQIKDHGP